MKLWTIDIEMVYLGVSEHGMPYDRAETLRVSADTAEDALNYVYLLFGDQPNVELKSVDIKG